MIVRSLCDAISMVTPTICSGVTAPRRDAPCRNLSSCGSLWIWITRPVGPTSLRPLPLGLRFHRRRNLRTIARVYSQFLSASAKTRPNPIGPIRPLVCLRGKSGCVGAGCMPIIIYGSLDGRDQGSVLSSSSQLRLGTQASEKSRLRPSLVAASSSADWVKKNWCLGLESV